MNISKLAINGSRKIKGFQHLDVVTMQSKIYKSFVIIRNLIYLLAVSLTIVSSMNLSNVRLVEQNDSRLVATSNYNYAIASPKLATKNWKTVSVNGDRVSIITLNGEKISSTKTQLGEVDRLFIESLRDEIGNSNGGFTHYSMAGGTGGGEFSSGNIMMSSTLDGGSANSNSFSSSSTSSTGGGIQTVTQGIQGGSIQSNGLSVNVKDENNFSVSKTDLPFNWSRVFFNGDLVTIVTRDGEVDMRPMNSMEVAQLDAITKLKLEIKDLQKRQRQQFSDTMQNSMDMVSSIFNNVMGRFPKPPSYGSAVGNMFGDNFPFGPNNSPFSSLSGWPFGQGGATASSGVGGSGGAFAFAGGRR